MCGANPTGSSPSTWADNGTMFTTSRPVLRYWKHALLAAVFATVMFGGSGMILRATDKLSLTYGFVVLIW
jgi:hypothetical protein